MSKLKVNLGWTISSNGGAKINDVSDEMATLQVFAALSGELLTAS